MQKQKQELTFSENKGHSDTNVKLMKIFLSQYLISEGFKKAQEHAINLLTDLLIKYIKKIGVKVKRITQLQGRNETNIFQLLFEVDTNMKITLNSILDYISENQNKEVINKDNQGKEEIVKPKKENYFIRNLIKDIFQNESNNDIEEDREFSNIKKAEDNFEGLRAVEEVKNIKTLSDSRSIMKLINRKQPELPKSKETEEQEGYKESDIKLLKAQQKRYFVSQLLRIRRPVEEMNNKRKLKEIYDQENELEIPEIQFKKNFAEDEKDGNNEGDKSKKSEQKQVNTLNPFSIPSKKVKEIKLDDFSI
ncbi:hypothetical protein ABPG74_002960 [Tetrahymena malaccensis]